MMWEALIGGAVGGLLGGPWGLAAGAALGAGLDIFRDRALPPLDFRPHIEPGEDGWVVSVRTSLPDGCLVLLHARDAEGGFLPATAARFSDAHDRLTIISRTAKGVAQLFVPYGVVAGQRDTLTISLRLYHSSQADSLDLIGEEQVTAPWPDTPYRAARFWRPLLGLCMAVVRADGRIERVELEQVKARVAAGLRIPAEEGALVHEILRTEPHAPLPQLVDQLLLRAPDLPPEAVISALVDVARADAHIHDAEATIIIETAHLLGITGEDWHALARRLGIDAIDRLHHYRALLGVDASADRDTIEQAWRDRMAALAPERLAALPAEFQALAWRRTDALQRARAALLGD